MISVMETLTELTRHSSGRTPQGTGLKHSWDDILDGQPHRLRSGEDYTLAAITVRQYAYREGTRRGGAASVSILDGGNTVEIVYYPPGSPQYRQIMENRRRRAR